MLLHKQTRMILDTTPGPRLFLYKHMNTYSGLHNLLRLVQWSSILRTICM